MQDATTAAPVQPCCNLCGGDAFGPGPGGRPGHLGRAPHCLRCGSLERHRVAGRVLQALPADDLDWRRALLVGPERGADARWLRHCDLAQSPAAACLPPGLDDCEDGSYDFIALVHVLEYLDNDQDGFEQLLRLLSPQGLLQICFVDPRARPWTAIQAGPAGSARRWYGRDVYHHFRCQGRRVRMTMREAADPATGLVLPVHFFYKQARYHAALDAPGAATI